MNYGIFTLSLSLIFSKVRSKLLEKKMSLERSEKARKLREMRKYGKKVCSPYLSLCLIIYRAWHSMYSTNLRDREQKEAEMSDVKDKVKTSMANTQTVDINLLHS